MFKVGKVYRHYNGSKEFLVLEVNPQTNKLKYLVDSGIYQYYAKLSTLEEIFSEHLEVK